MSNANAKSNANANKLMLVDILALAFHRVIIRLQENRAVLTINSDRRVKVKGLRSEARLSADKANIYHQTLMRQQARRFDASKVRVIPARPPVVSSKAIIAQPTPRKVRSKITAPTSKRCHYRNCNRILIAKRKGRKKYCDEVESKIPGYQGCKNSEHKARRNANAIP